MWGVRGGVGVSGVLLYLVSSISDEMLQEVFLCCLS